VTALLFFSMMFLVTYQPVSLYLMRAQLGQLLNRTTEKTDILAAFNAGQLAFFSDRQTVNLDGLVNDNEFFRHVLNKPGSIVPYLRANNVRYVVDYDLYWAAEQIAGNTEIRSTWAIPDPRFQRTFYVRELQK
jgi:hypothetical protein